MSTGTLFQWDEAWLEKWPRRERRGPPRCDRCGRDLTHEPVSPLSPYCRACVDQILADLESEP
jgi:hypothetical protein